MNPKTYKREVAICMLLFLAGMCIGGLYHEGAAETARFLTYPLLGWAGAAFALDWKYKQADY